MKKADDITYQCDSCGNIDPMGTTPCKCGSTAVCPVPCCTLEDVTAELHKIGYNAGMYNTGGHVMCIAVAKVGESLDKYRLFIGNECGWGADIYDGDGEHTGSVNLEEIKPLDSALQIAETLVQAIIAQTVGEPC